MTHDRYNPWKLTTIGLALVIVTALITGLVVASWNREPEKQAAVTAPAAVPRPPTASPVPSAPPRRMATAPSPAEVEACNAQANTRASDKAIEVVKDAAIGGAVGAGVGAAGGAIAGGGKTAGKGAGIGGILGLAAGTLYGLNETKSHDARYVEAYRACMKERGHIG
jgi:hypothetical protein